MVVHLLWKVIIRHSWRSICHQIIRSSKLTLWSKWLDGWSSRRLHHPLCGVDWLHSRFQMFYSVDLGWSVQPIGKGHHSYFLKVYWPIMVWKNNAPYIKILFFSTAHITCLGSCTSQDFSHLNLCHFTEGNSSCSINSSIHFTSVSQSS